MRVLTKEKRLPMLPTRVLTLLLSLLLSVGASGQGTQRRTTVVADRDTHEPIAQASLYTKDGGSFRSSISNNAGVAVVDFEFRRLTVSHLNYEKAQVQHLTDTVFLTPRYRQTREVVVRNVEPAWIRPFLRRFVHVKDYRYFYRPALLSYDYTTQSISSANLYRFHSVGLLRPKDRHREQHAICQQEGVVTSVDTLLLTDVANLRRMLYEDFVQELDADFIADHIFRENSAFQGNPGEIELAFRAKHRDDDRGRMVVDTARCVVLSAWRQCGTKTNRQLRMPQMLYIMARAMTGYRVEQWNTFYSVTYALLPDGQLYPRDVRFKFFFVNYDHSDDEEENAYHRQTGGGFPNMEATLHLAPATVSEPDSLTWKTLPGSWYIRLSSEESRQQEVQLANLPCRFEAFVDE